jgi:hypothetical protein
VATPPQQILRLAFGFAYSAAGRPIDVSYAGAATVHFETTSGGFLGAPDFWHSSLDSAKSAITSDPACGPAH